MLLLPVLAVLGSSCSPDLTPVTAVTNLRVLAVALDPPEVGPGETATFRLLVTDPAGEGRDLDWMVTLCTPSDATGGCVEYDDITERYAGPGASSCQEETCTRMCDQLCQDDTCSGADFLSCCIACEFRTCCVRGGTGTPVDGVLEVDGSDFPPLTFSGSVLAGLSEAEAEEGANAQLTILVCESGVCFEQVQEGADSGEGGGTSLSPDTLAYVLPPDQSAVAIKRARVSGADPSERNVNPGLEGILVDGVLHRDGDSVEVPFETAVELIPVLSSGSIEHYAYQASNGTVETRCEAVYHSWYATDGSFEEAYTEPDPEMGCLYGGGTFVESGNLWTAPASDDVHDQEPVLFLVVRDRRGGMDWLSLDIILR